MTDSTSLYEKFKNAKYYIALDGIRCICILGVIWHHSRPVDMPRILQRGFLGVDLFFVISGFLITSLVIKEKESTGQFSLPQFYLRRILRIFPLYFGFIAAIAAVYFIGKPHDPETAKLAELMPLYLLFLSNWSISQMSLMTVYWSLAAEEQFYLVWPAVEKLASPRLAMALLASALLINQVVNFGLLDHWIATVWDPRAPYLKIIDATFTPILLGVLLAHCLHHRQAFAAIAKVLGGHLATPITAVVLFTIVLFAPNELSGWPRLLIQLTMTALIAALVIRQDTPYARALTAPPLKRIGQISYGMYVYHKGAIFLVTALVPVGLLELLGSTFVLSALLTYVLSELSFRYYEKPFLTFKHNHQMRRRTGSAAIADSPT